MENLASTLGLSHETFLIWHDVWCGWGALCLMAKCVLSARVPCVRVWKVNYEHKSHTLSRAMGNDVCAKSIYA